MSTKLDSDVIVIPNDATAPGIISFSGDPTSLGIVANVGSLGLRVDTPSLYMMTSIGWRQVSPAVTTTLAYDCVISASLTGNVNTTVDDWEPGTLGQNTLIRLTCTGIVNLSGLVGGVDGKVVTIALLDNGNNALNIVNNAQSTAGNRLLVYSAANDNIPLQGAVTLRYDASASRWRTVGVCRF
jgi:hypothetical protein